MMKTLEFAALAAVCTGLTAFGATKEVSTEADDEGRVIVTEKEAKTKSDTSAFVMEPLGEEGHLKLNSEMPNKPTFRAKKPFEPGLRLFGAGGKDAVIVARHGVEVQRTLNELRWHLEEMIGRDVAVVPRFPDDGTPAIVIEFAKKLDASEHSLVHVEGNVLWIEGTDGIGMSHALTYVLESLGCRYLWAGRNGTWPWSQRSPFGPTRKARELPLMRPGPRTVTFSCSMQRKRCPPWCASLTLRQFCGQTSHGL